MEYLSLQLYGHYAALRAPSPDAGAAFRLSPARPARWGLLGYWVFHGLSLSLAWGVPSRVSLMKSQQTLSRVDLSEAPNDRKACMRGISTARPVYVPYGSVRAYDH